MRFGLALPQYGFSQPDGAPVDFEVTAAWARKAEDLGFDSVWLSDHFFYSFSRYGADPSAISALEPMTSLAALATVTSRVRLGTLVLCSPFRRPAVLGRMAKTVDALSSGRLDLGLGAGWLEEEFRAFGFEFGGIGERFSLLERTLQELTEPPIKVDLPILLGGKGGPRLLHLAARYATGWNTVWRVEPGGYAARVRDLEDACDSLGRDPGTFRLSIGLYSLVEEDEKGARDAFERGRETFPGNAMAADSWDSWRADTLSGSPQQAIERVQEFEELGVDEIVVSAGTLPFAVHEPRSVEVLAERVVAPLRAGA